MPLATTIGCDRCAQLSDEALAMAGGIKRIGPLVVDLQRGVVLHPVFSGFTALEKQMVLALVRAYPSMATYEELAGERFDRMFGPDQHNIRVRASRVRRKLAPLGLWLFAVDRQGYQVVIGETDAGRISSLIAQLPRAKQTIAQCLGPRGGCGPELPDED